MIEADKPADTSKVQSIRWDSSEWETLQAAAEALEKQTHMRIAVADIVRSGAMLKAKEVLAESGTVTEPDNARRAGDERREVEA